MSQGREDLVQLVWDRLVANVDDGMTEQQREEEEQKRRKEKEERENQKIVSR